MDDDNSNEPLKGDEMHDIIDQEHLFQEQKKFQEGHDIFNQLVSNQQELYKLPTLVPLESENINKFLIEHKQQPKMDFGQSQSQSDKLIMEIVQKTGEYLKQNVKQFEVGQTHDFKFTLPNSIFPEDQNKPLIQYHNFGGNNQYENELLYKDSLTSEQIKQIANEGTFDVPSQKYQGQKYVWKLHRYIITGSLRIKNFTFEKLAQSLEQFQSIPNYFKQKAKICENRCNKFSIYNAMRNLIAFFYQIIQMLISFPLHKIQLDKQQLFTTMYTRYFESVLQKILQQNHQDKEHLQFWTMEQVNRFKKVLAELEKDFYTEVWHLQYAKAIEGSLQNDKYFLQRLQEQKYTHLEQFIQSYTKFSDPQDNKDYSDSVRDSLVQYVKAYKIITKVIFDSIHAEDEKRKQNQQLIIEEHPLRSKIEEYRTRILQDLSAIYKNETIVNAKKTIAEQLNIQQSQQGLLQFDSFLTWQETAEQEYQSLKKQRTQLVPYDELTVTRLLFPKWQVGQTEIPGEWENNHQLPNQIRYHLIKTIVYSIPTDEWLWRFRVFLIRLYTYVNNAIFVLFFQSLVGPAGLRALFGTHKYSSSKTINAHTGVISDAPANNSTVLGAFGSVWSDIQQDRDHFENQPNTGLFGKKISRLCNLLYNYVFKFLFVAVICALICFPIVIILNFAISMFLCVTAVLWVPVFLLIWKAFQILIYDSDNRGFKVYGDKHEIVPRQWFPLPAEILMSLVYRFAFQLTYSLIVIVIVLPLVSIILFVFAVLYFLFRHLMDLFMMIIVRCAARQPATESCIARKIQYPGMNEKFFSYIDYEDILILVNTYLEKQELEFYEKHMRALIQRPLEEYKTACEKLLQPLNASLNGTSLEKVDICEKRLLKSLDKTLASRRKKYPTEPSNVRYYKDELEATIRNVAILIEGIINEKQMAFIWAVEGIDENQYAFLSKRILAKILGEQFLEPLEDLDKRTILVSERQSHFKKITDYIAGDNQALERHLPEREAKEAQAQKIQVPVFVKLSQDVMAYSNPQLLGQNYRSQAKDFYNGGQYRCWINSLFLVAFAQHVVQQIQVAQNEVNLNMQIRQKKQKNI